MFDKKVHLSGKYYAVVPFLFSSKGLSAGGWGGGSQLKNK